MLWAWLLILAGPAHAQFPSLSIHDLQTVSAPDLQNCLDASQYVGDTVFVRGVVVTAPDSNTISTGNPGLGQVWLQSGNGPFSGLGVMQPDPSAVNPLQTLVKGDSILISGVVDESSKDTQLLLNGSTTTTLISAGNAIYIDTVAICDLNDAQSINQLTTGEQWEGSYIQLNEVVVTQVDYFSGGTRVQFTVADPVSGCQVRVQDRFLVNRLPNGFPSGNFVPFNIGDQLCYIRGILVHAPNGCAATPGGGGYVLFPTQVDDYDAVTPCGTGTANEAPQSQELELYPNPSQGHFQLVLPFEPIDRTMLKVVNPLGQEVASIGIDQKTTVIDLSHLEDGQYWVGIQGRNKEECLSKNLVIQK